MAYIEVFAALADPTCRQVFEASRGQAKTAGEVAAGLLASRPTVSQHLNVLD